MEPMLVECGACVARGHGCADCVVSVLLGMPEAAGGELADDERRALDALASGGLLPPLRLSITPRAGKQRRAGPADADGAARASG